MFNFCAGCKELEKIKVIRLSDLEINEEGKIFFISGSNNFITKMMELGFTKNTNIKVLKKSPFDDPISVSIRGYELIIKKNEADLISIVKNEKRNI